MNSTVSLPTQPTNPVALETRLFRLEETLLQQEEVIQSLCRLAVRHQLPLPETTLIQSHLEFCNWLFTQKELGLI